MRPVPSLPGVLFVLIRPPPTVMYVASAGVEV
jgi:hypothetical protein